MGISVSIAQIKKIQKLNSFASGRTLPTQSTGPQPIQLVPKNCFLQISQYRSLKSKKFKKQSPFIFKFCLWKDPPHPVNWSPTHSTGPQKSFLYRYLSIGHSNKKIQKHIPFIFE